MSDEAPEQPAPNPEPRSEDLDGLLVEIGETLGDPEQPPAPPVPSTPWPGWRVWALAGALGGAVAGALVAGNVWANPGMLVFAHGLPAWASGAIDGGLIGSMSGPACLIWERVRRGVVVKGFLGVGMIVFLSAAALTLAALLINNLISLVFEQRLYLPPPIHCLSGFWANLVYGCALGAGVLSHVWSRSLVSRLFFSWALCMAACLPVLLVGQRMFPYSYLPDLTAFWRAGFPYYLALPLSWWIASRFAPDPLPVLRGDEKSSDDA